jgi:Immunity protein 42
MMIGNPNIFAVESQITQISEWRSQMALGFFVLHISGRAYGVKQPDATMLGALLNDVARRIVGRGSHSIPAVVDAEPSKIASTFRRAVYGECEEQEVFFGMTASDFRNAISSNYVEWTAYGDEAFDDGSYVLQFDNGDQVRLIAFVGTPDFQYDPDSLRDCHLSQKEFYTVLEDWLDAFGRERKSLTPPETAMPL